MGDEKEDLTRIEDLFEFEHEEDLEAEQKLKEVTQALEQKVDVTDDDAATISELPDETPPAFPIPDLDEEEEEGEQEQPEEESEEELSFTDQGTEAFSIEEESETEPLEEGPSEEGDFFDAETEADIQFEAEEQSDDETEFGEAPDFEIEDEAETEAEFELEAESETEFEFEADGDELMTDTDTDTESETELMLELEPEPVIEAEPEFEPEPVIEQTPPPVTEPETFEDIQEFGKSIQYGEIAAGGNPPYSIILKNIKYVEDSEDILIILREHGIVTEESEKDIMQGLSNGSLLIPQISEYAAIFLAHKLRRFDLDVLMGLSDELHPPKSYESDGKGLINKKHLKQNKTESLNVEEIPVNINSILIATTPSLEGYKILRYVDVVSEHVVLPEDEVRNIEDKDGNELYHNLAQELRTKALKLKGNAVVGVNYQLTPLPAVDDIVSYKVTCTGNVVWISNEGSVAND